MSSPAAERTRAFIMSLLFSDFRDSSYTFAPVGSRGFRRLDETPSGGRVEQLVTLQSVAQLIVAEAERGGGRALIEAVALEAILEQRTLVSGDCCPEVVGRLDWRRRRRSDRLSCGPRF